MVDLKVDLLTSEVGRLALRDVSHLHPGYTWVSTYDGDTSRVPDCRVSLPNLAFSHSRTARDLKTMLVFMLANRLMVGALPKPLVLVPRNKAHFERAMYRFPWPCLITNNIPLLNGETVCDRE